VGSIGLTQLSMKKSVENSAGVCAPVGCLDVVAPGMMRRSSPTHRFGYGLSASLAMSRSRGFTLTLHGCSALFSFPSLPPRRGWQRRERCPQSFRPRITRQPVWVGTPGHRRARMGSLSPSSILLHEPYEMPQEYACSPPGHSIPPRGGLCGGALRVRWVALLALQPGTACAVLRGAPVSEFGPPPTPRRRRPRLQPQNPRGFRTLRAAPALPLPPRGRPGGKKPQPGQAE